MSNNNLPGEGIGSNLNNNFQNYKNMDRQEKKRFWGEFFTKTAIYIILAIFIVFVAIQEPEFLSLPSIIDIIKKSASGLILALGVGGIIVLTGTDLSAGRVLGLTACIAASLLQRSDYASRMFPNLKPLPIIVVLLLVMAIGAIIGFVNGYFVSKFSLHPFIVTLSTQLMVYGGILIYLKQGTNEGKAISGLSPEYNRFVKGSFFSIAGNSIPNYVWFAIAIAIIMWIIWNKTVLGKNMYAVGSNPEAANVSGVNVAGTIIMIFTIAGILYGIAGFIEAARIGSNSASTGVNYELDAIAACVIGGVSFTGGVGKISGIITGVVLLQLITVGLQWLSVPSDFQYIIKGIIILGAVAIDMKKYLAKK